MGKARGPRRKQAPARSNRLLGNNSSSSLVSKSVRRQKNGKGESHLAGGPNGGTAMTMRTGGQQLLTTTNKRSRGGKRRRKKDGPDAQPKRSSETAAIEAEYAAVDARATARQISEDTARSRGASRIRLAPATANLSMPSQGGASTQGSGGVPSSVKIVDALLYSISDDPATRAAPARPVRAAPRKRKGNPYAVLEEESDQEEIDGRSKQGPNAVGSRRDVGGSSSGQALAFVAPRGFSGISMSGGGGGGDGVATGAPSRGTASSALHHDDEDPDL